MAIEDEPEEFKQRLISIESEVLLKKIISRDLNDFDAMRITKAHKTISEIPLYLLKKQTEWKKIEARIHLLKFEIPELKLVVIDYLNVIQHGRYRNRWENIAEISVGCKHLASTIRAPVMLLCQINRQTENRRDHKPTLGDLRDSGTIEQDADIVMLLYRKSYYDKTGDPTTLVSIAKQRNGPIGSFELEFDSETLRFL